MDEKKAILEENYDEYFDQAAYALSKEKYNSATTLFFKAICAATDLFILLNEGNVPSSHTKRFRIVEEKYSGIYDILDKDFPFYQDSYTKKMTKEVVEVLKEDAEKIKRKCEEYGNKETDEDT
jgi:hypothetical protein